MALSTPLPPGLQRIMAGSAAVHLGLFVFMALWGKFGFRPDPPPPMSFIPTKLVKLGKERPKDLLPRAQREPPPPPKPEVNLTKPATKNAPTTEAKPQEALPDALQRAKEASAVSSALDRLKKTAKSVDDSGSPDGVEGGEVSDLSKAIMGNKFATEIYRCMKKNYAIEGVSRDKVRGREATVVVRVKADGTLFGTRLLKSSKLRAFDKAVERAVTRCGKVSKPPKALASTLNEDGIEIVFKP